MIDIRDIHGNFIFSTSIDGGSKRKFTLMKEDYITLKFNLDVPVYFKLGDGIDDSEIGLFELVDLYKPTRNDSTGGYDYELRLDAYYWKWKNKKFFYTPDTGGSEASWNLTATLAVHLNVFLKNLSTLGYTYKGTAFEFSIDSTVENSAKLVSYDNTNLIDALTNLADTWDCEWWITDNIIHFGRCEYGDPVDFEYGVNVSSMSRSDSQSSYATRIYAFGSTRNLPTNYRPIDENLVVNSVVQKRLMLPSGTPYIDAYENMSTEEAVEDIVVFEDIYPKRVGTISEVSQTSGNYLDQDNNPTGETYPIYTIKDLSLINFKKEYLLSGVELRFVFQSGALFGLDFALTLKSSDDTGTVFEIVRNEDYGRYLPDEVLKPQIGDTYVLYGFDTSLVSDTMIPAAEQELKEKALAYVEKTKIDPSTYDCKMSSEYMSNGGTQRTFAVGDKVNLINPAYFEAGRESRIIGFEYNLDYPYDNPTYTVGETASYSRLSEIEQKVDAVTYKGQTYTGSGGSGVYVIGRNDSTVPTDRNVLSSLRSLASFLRKDQPDTAAGLITFIEGLVSKKVITAEDGLLLGKYVTGISGGKIDSDGDAEVRNLIVRIKATVAALEAKTVTVTDKITTLNLLVQKLAETYDLNVSNVATLFQTIVKDYVSSESFVPGITGEGMKLYKALNGDWNLEVDNVVIRKAMTVFELIISKVRAVNGGLVVSPANGRIKSVTETTGSPTYYVLGIEGDMTFVADDLVRCQVFSSTGAKYYWVPIDSVSGETILILKSNFPDGVVPAVGDDLVQMGNKSNTARQGVLYLTASEDGKPRFSVLDGVNSTDLTGKSKVILGCLDGITDSDFPSDAQPHGYGLWAGNVFLKGLFILRNGKSIEDELSDQITAVQTAFEIREGQISTKVTQATQAAAEASGYASSAAGSASSANQSLTTITQKESSINQTANEITLKVTRAESAAGRAESAEASINLKADGIVLQASNQAAQTAVDGVQVGTRNLIRNGSKFQNLNYWSLYNNANGVVTQDGVSIRNDGWSGFEPAVQLASEVPFTSGNIIIYQDVVLVIGQQYTFTAHLAGHRSYKGITIADSVDGHELAGQVWDIGDIYGGDNINSWATPKLSFVATSKGARVHIILGPADFAGMYLWVKDISLVQGNKGADWSPSPEDVAADYTARIDVLSNQISSKVSQTAFDSLSGTVNTHSTAITQLPNTIDARITTQTQAGGIIKTQVESWFTLSENVLSLGAKSVNITGATVFSSLATNDSVTNAINAVQVGGANLLPNSDFSNYVIDNSIGWDNALNGKYNISSWGSGFNGGVTSPTIGYHAHLNTTKFGFPVLEYINKNSAYGLAHRWMGISSGVYNKENLSPGQQYSFSADVMIDTSGMCIHGGIYSRKTGGTSYNFYSGQYTLVPTIINAWQRVSYTFILDKDIDLSGGVSFYIYGFAGTEGIAWVKNASLQLGTKGSFVRCDADITADAQNKANAAQTAAVTNSRNNLATSLGYADYSAMEAQAIAGNAIINGGMIRTSLIDAQAIVTGQLVANIILSTDITTGKLTVTDGAKVGPFIVSSGRASLTATSGSDSMLLSANLIRFIGSDSNVYIGGDTFPASMGGALLCPQRTVVTRSITAFGYGNVGHYLNVEGASSYDDTNAQYTGNHALYIPKGDICGFRLRIRTVSSSQTLSVFDSIIISVADSEISLTLPTSAEKGQIYFIRKNGGGRVWINGSYIINDGDWYRERSTSVQLNKGGLGILMYNGTYWTWNSTNG